jgi:hypothetical protein
MPRIETLEQAKHFIYGPKAYACAPLPWKAPIISYQRPESVIRPEVASDARAESAPPANLVTFPR